VRIRSVFSHSAQAIAEGALISLLVVGLMAGTAFAAKGGGGKPSGGTSGGGTLALVLVTDQNGNGSPNRGDTVAFNISTTATEPFVNLRCYQSGVLVLNGSQGYFDGALNSSRNFGLGSGAWQSGAADCTAWLDVYTKQGWSHLGSTSFHVDA
jgi:hypothetical protein